LLTVATTLARWLGTLTPQALGTLLSRRPEALAPPSPRDLADLAGRLQGRLGVLRAYEAMTLPAVQLVEVLLAFQCDSRPELAELVGSEGLDEVLRLLAEHALVWEFDGRLGLAGELTSAHRQPLRLGPGVAALLDQWTAAELRGLAAALGLEVPAAKREVVGELAARFADGEWVRALAATAPTGAEALLDRMAWQNPGWIGVSSPPEDAVERPDAEAERWLTRHGLLHVDKLRLLTMPREVAVALRGSEWRPPFDHRRPRPRLEQLDMRVERFLALPQFQQCEFVGSVDALEHLELQAACILARLLAAFGKCLGEFSPLAGDGVELYDETDCGHDCSSR